MWHNSKLRLCVAYFTEVWVEYVLGVIVWDYILQILLGSGLFVQYTQRALESIFSCYFCPTIGSVSLVYSRQHISVRHDTIWVGLEHLGLYWISAVGCVDDRVTTEAWHSPINSAKKKIKQEQVDIFRIMYETLIKKQKHKQDWKKIKFRRQTDCIKCSWTP